MIRFDRISPGRNIISLKDFPKMNSDDVIKNLINNLRKRVNEISDSHVYAPISEGTTFSDKTFYARGVAFKIAQDAENKAGHMLEVSVLHPEKETELTRPLAYGDKNAISDYLNNEKSIDSVLQHVKLMCAELKSE